MGQRNAHEEIRQLSDRLVASSVKCTAWHVSLGTERHKIEAAIRNLTTADSREDALELARQLRDIKSRMTQVCRVNKRINALRDQSMQLHHQTNIEQSMKDIVAGIALVESVTGTPQLSRLAAEFDEANTRLELRTQMTDEDLLPAVGDDAAADSADDTADLERLLHSVRNPEPLVGFDDRGGGGVEAVRPYQQQQQQPYASVAPPPPPRAVVVPPVQPTVRSPVATARIGSASTRPSHAVVEDILLGAPSPPRD